MADLTDARERGQLFIIGAFALATVFLVLAVLLNSVIYAGSVATRDDGTHAEPALEYEREATVAAADVVREVTRTPNGSASTAEAETRLETELARWRTLAGYHVTYRGAVGNVTVDATTPGTYGAQTNSSRSLRSAAAESNWTLVRNASVRAYEARIRPTATADAGATESDVLPDAFHVRVVENGTGDVWTVAVFNDGGNTCVKTFRPDGTADSSCLPDSTVSVSFTDGTLNGTRSHALGFLSRNESYTVAYRNGGAARGTYGLVAEGNSSSIEATNFVNATATPDPESVESPFHSPGVYDATLQISYRGQNVEYATTVRVAPGEPDA